MIINESKRLNEGYGYKLVIKDENGRVIDTKVGSQDALKDQAKRMRDQYKRMGAKYKVSVVKESIDKKSSRELHAMNTDELRDYAASLGADKNKLYGTSKDVILRMCIDLQNKSKNESCDDEDKELKEDTVQNSDGTWSNVGKEGSHGKFKDKKSADAQRKAMFANGYSAG